MDPQASDILTELADRVQNVEALVWAIVAILFIGAVAGLIRAIKGKKE